MTAINQLMRQHTEIIIRKSDKGDTIAAETIDYCITDGLQDLSDE